MADREPSNKLRVDLYRVLLPEIQRQDRLSGAQGPVLHWNDPDAEWDFLTLHPRAPDALNAVWNKIGLAPLWKELFHVIETLEGEDLAVLETLDALIDPVTCPESRLPDLAASFGYRLAQGLSEEAKRLAILGLIAAFKSRGTPISFKVFYRLLGFSAVNVFPLWKKEIHEALGDYSRVRYAVVPVMNVPVGPAGSSAFVGTLADAPIEPGSLRFFDTGVGGVTIRDDNGALLGPAGETGTIDYKTGAFQLVLTAPAIGSVTASLNKVTEEWPYHAARIDLEILISAGGGGPVPVIDGEAVAELLVRMEEVRPIHVLLRNFALVSEIHDIFGADNASGATDRAACVQTRKDVRDGPPGRDFTFILDAGPGAEDDLTIEQRDPGTHITSVLDKNFEDKAAIVCPLDTLIIHFSNGDPDIYA